MRWDMSVQSRAISTIVKEIVATTKPSTVTAASTVSAANRNVEKRPKKSTVKKHRVPKWVELNELFNPHYTAGSKIPPARRNGITHFFNTAEVQFEKGIYNKDELVETVPNRKILPEVAFLGRSNAGKSTLLNSLMTNTHQKALDKYAKASKRPGYTKSLNFFNIGNKFRIVDTPGYGFKSTLHQGTLTTTYLQARKQLLRTFVLFPGDQKISPLDRDIIEFLIAKGIPFEVVFTKMDKVKNLKEFEETISDSGLRKLPTLPRLVFTSASKLAGSAQRYGITDLRSAIIDACNVEI